MSEQDENNVFEEEQLIDSESVKVENHEDEKQDTKENGISSYVKNMSSFAKLFWICLLMLSIAYVILISMARYNSSAVRNDHNTTSPRIDEIIQEVEVIVTSDRMQKNLENNRTVAEINKNLKKNMLMLDQKIDKEINDTFHLVYSNIDPFLDFHYSVIGEYMELGGMAAGTMEKMIEQKLFGSDFSVRLKDSLKMVSNEYEIRLSDHFDFINQNATTSVNINLNSQIMTDIKKQIDQNMKVQGGKIAMLISVKLAPKLVQIAATKIAAKSSTKIAAKMATKLGTKSAAAATGATAGALCGPAFWICSPVAAGVLWFGTDAVISSIDEIYNRDEFKQDIMDTLVKQQSAIKRKLKASYQRSAQKLSNEIMMKYKQAPIKKIEKVKIKEKIGL